MTTNQLARDWAATQLLIKERRDTVAEAQKELSRVENTANNLEKELGSCVGRNIQRKCFGIDSTHVVIITYRAQGANSIELENVI